MSFQQLLGNWEPGHNVTHFLTLSAFLGPNFVNEFLFEFHFKHSQPPPDWMNIFTASSLGGAVQTHGHRGPEQDVRAQNKVISDLPRAAKETASSQYEECWDPNRFWDVIYQTFQLSLLQSVSRPTESEGAKFILHPLIRDWLQLRQAPRERQGYTREAVDVVDSSIRMHNVANSDAQAKSSILLHMDAVLESDNEFFSDKHHLGRDISTCERARRFSMFYYEQGRYEASLGLIRVVIKTNENMLGKEHPKTLTSMSDLAHVLGKQGRLYKAEQIFQEVLRTRERVLSKDDPALLVAKNNLTGVLYAQNKLIEAQQMIREIKNTEGVRGKEHPYTLAAINNLALMLDQQGKHAKAEQMHREVIAVRERVLGKEHDSTLRSVRNLAQALSNQAKFTEAEQTYYKVVDVLERVLGKEHPDTLGSLRSLARVLGQQGKYMKAEQIFCTVIDAMERVMGKAHPDRIYAMNDFVIVLSREGKYAEAEDVQLQAYEASLIFSGLQDPVVKTYIDTLPVGL